MNKYEKLYKHALRTKLSILDIETLFILKERATPKQPIISELLFNNCPNNCMRNRYVGSNHNFCPNCGQALDWEATLSNDKTLNNEV